MSCTPHHTTPQHPQSIRRRPRATSRPFTEDPLHPTRPAPWSLPTALWCARTRAWAAVGGCTRARPSGLATWSGGRSRRQSPSSRPRRARLPGSRPSQRRPKQRTGTSCASLPVGGLLPALRRGGNSRSTRCSQVQDRRGRVPEPAGVQRPAVRPIRARQVGGPVHVRPPCRSDCLTVPTLSTRCCSPAGSPLSRAGT